MLADWQNETKSHLDEDKVVENLKGDLLLK